MSVCFSSCPQLTQSPFEDLGIQGEEMRSRMNPEARRSGCAARQQCQTAEHDQHKERVIAAVTGLVRHITAFSQNIEECIYTHKPFIFQWEWEKCIMELIVCSSLSDDMNSSTIVSVRTSSVLWNWHFPDMFKATFGRLLQQKTHNNESSLRKKKYQFILYVSFFLYQLM